MGYLGKEPISPLCPPPFSFFTQVACTGVQDSLEEIVKVKALGKSVSYNFAVDCMVKMDVSYFTITK